MAQRCLFRGEWKKEDSKQVYGCIYHNEPNSLRFRDKCTYKNLKKCKLFMDREEYKRR